MTPGQTVYRVKFLQLPPVVRVAVFVSKNHGWRTYRDSQGEWKENGHGFWEVSMEAAVRDAIKTLLSPLGVFRSYASVKQYEPNLIALYELLGRVLRAGSRRDPGDTAKELARMVLDPAGCDLVAARKLADWFAEFVSLSEAS